MLDEGTAPSTTWRAARTPRRTTSPPALPRRRRAAGGDAAPGDAGARGLAAAGGRRGDRGGVRGGLRLRRGLQPGVRPGLRPPAERTAAGRRATGCRRPTASTSTRPPRCGSTAPGAHHERPTADSPSDGPPRPRRHPRPARRWPSSCPTTTTAGVRPGQAVLSLGRPRRVGGAGAAAPRVHQGGLAGGDPGRGLPGPRGRRPVDLVARHEAVAAALAGAGARHRAARRLGRPDRRRAVRPAGELRARQRGRPRPHLLRPPPAAGPAMLRDAGVAVDQGDPIDWLRRRTGGTP